MSLKGKNVEERLWNYLKSKGLNEYGIAGLMGNLFAESGLITNRVEILCLNVLKRHGKNYTKKSYTADVDSGKITRQEFLHPLPNKQYGYGLAQWTSPSRKAGLYDEAKKRKVSIGDEQLAYDYLMKELTTSYSSILRVLKNATSVKQASDKVLIDFESPADTSDAVKNLRAGYGQKYYDKYHTKTNTEKAIEKLIEIASGEIGYLEKASNSQLYDKTANAGYNNYTKYWVEVCPSLQANYWCACFVSWCFKEAFGLETAKTLLKHWPYVYCPTLGQLFTKYANPQKGDIVIFYRNGEFCHTGIVIDVQGDLFYTIEGNTSGGSSITPNGGGVVKKSYYNSQLPGTKFCRPNYSIVKFEEPVTPYFIVGAKYRMDLSMALRKGPKADAEYVKFDDIPAAKQKYSKKGKNGEALIKKGTVDKCYGEIKVGTRGIYMKVLRGWILAQLNGKDRVTEVK